MKVTPFQLIQWKHAIRLEEKGLKHSRGSVNAHASRAFGLKVPTDRAIVLEQIDKAIEACKAAGVGTLDVVEIETE